MDVLRQWAHDQPQPEPPPAFEVRLYRRLARELRQDASPPRKGSSWQLRGMALVAASLLLLMMAWIPPDKRRLGLSKVQTTWNYTLRKGAEWLEAPFQWLDKLIFWTEKEK